MPHTPLAERLRAVVSTAAEATSRGVESERVIEERASFPSRRDFLRKAGLAGAALATSPLAMAGKPGPSTARVAIIGAGLAGLTCAFRLKQAGIVAQVFEANTRLGGRCWTRRGDFLENQIAEHGGELIDQAHTSIRQLAQELRLPLDNLLAAEANGTEPLYFFDGSPYTYQEATDDMKAIWQKLHRDLSEASYPTIYSSFTERGLELDQMSITDWIEESVSGGISSRLGQLLDVAYNIEYGAECHLQSALNLLYLLGYSGQGQLRLFGPSNEKFHVRGGNDQISEALARSVQSQIHTASALTAVRRNSGGSYTLTFQGRAEVTVDKVVLALPFSILKTSVDLRRADFSDLKMTAIRELQMGTNSKLNVQFNRRHWREVGSNGDTFSDQGYQATWEVTRGQAGTSGILVDYTGGNIGASFGTGTPAQRASQFLSQIEPVLPGVSQSWNGRATVDFWPGNPYTRGSYSYWQVGQYTRFAGVEGARENNAHFCGEHTSIDAQGYLEGAVETGDRAAAEVVADLG
jgi:monoamine oxidase